MLIVFVLENLLCPLVRDLAARLPMVFSPIPRARIAHQARCSPRAGVYHLRHVRGRRLHLDATVLVTRADELGDLEAGCNETTAGLREREALGRELRASRARIVASGTAARPQVERDQHDRAQQQLLVFRLKLGMARRRAAREPSTMAELIEELHADLRTACQELRDLAGGSYPGPLEQRGLEAALSAALGRISPAAALACHLSRRHPLELESAIYFGCVEAVQHAVEHGGALTRLEVRVEEPGGSIQFSVADDGRDYDPAGTPPNPGRRNVSDRIAAMGGTVKTRSGPGREPTVIGCGPVTEALVWTPNSNRRSRDEALVWTPNSNRRSRDEALVWTPNSNRRSACA